jgi:hypothetical protein
MLSKLALAFFSSKNASPCRSSYPISSVKGVRCDQKKEDDTKVAWRHESAVLGS